MNKFHIAAGTFPTARDKKHMYNQANAPKGTQTITVLGTFAFLEIA